MLCRTAGPAVDLLNEDGVRLVQGALINRWNRTKVAETDPRREGHLI